MKRSEVRRLLQWSGGVRHAAYIIAHAIYQQGKGKAPSETYSGELNPRKSLARARADSKVIPPVRNERVQRTIERLVFTANLIKEPADAVIIGIPIIVSPGDNPEKVLDLLWVKLKGQAQADAILKTWPKTEKEYWEHIDALGGVIWWHQHELGHGRIKDDDGSIMVYLIKAQRTLETLVLELDPKFGIILDPIEAIRSRLRYYWDWYSSSKAAHLQAEFEKIICSACPFSEGAKASNSHIPCKVFPGVIYQLSAPHICGMLRNDWSQEELYTNIKKEAGEAALQAFKAKEAELAPKTETATA